MLEKPSEPRGSAVLGGPGERSAYTCLSFGKHLSYLVNSEGKKKTTAGFLVNKCDFLFEKAAAWHKALS